MNWRCAAVSLLLASPAAAADKTALARGPYLVDVTSVSAKVCWRPAASLDDYCEKIAGIPAGAGFEYGIPGFKNRFPAKSLSPSTVPTRFAVVGDLGDGSENQTRVAAVLEAAKPQFVLLTGDIVYPSGAPEDYDAKFFSVYRGLLSQIGFFPAVGNHDYGDAWTDGAGRRRFDAGYRQAFQRPRYYSFDAGPIHFVSIDDNRAYYVGGSEALDPGSPFMNWLDADLAGSNAIWKVVFLHISPYSTRRFHGDTAWLRRVLHPVFVKNKVDVVFAGHEHLYERTKPIDGVTYVTVGTGGAKLAKRPPAADYLEAQILAHGLVVAEAASANFSIMFYDDKGTELDEVVIPKIGAPPPQ